MNSTPLEFLDLNCSARDIEDYFERFEIWWLTHSKSDEDRKSAFFLNAAGKNAYTLIKNVAYPSPPVSVPYDDLKALLLQHVKPTNFEASERAKFHSMVSNSNPGIREFILDLLTQAAKCDFADLLDMQLKDRLIAGIKNTVLQNELLKLFNPTFKDVLAYCEQHQDIRATTSSMPSTIESTAMFNSLKAESTKAHATAERFKPVTQSNSHNVTYSDKSYGNCASCGKRHSRFTCRFRYASCHKCGKTGHIQSVCRSTKTCRLIQARNSEVSDMAEHFSFLSLAITSHSGRIRKRLFSSTGHSLHFILDTSSVESLISVHDLKLFARDAKLQPSTVTINGITGHSLPVIGSCEISVSDEHSKTVTCTFIVTKSGPSILGLKAMQ
ncbi:unnamed protein product, partial [Echinostoma caproni]|uniref:CCHC-type domain-containing protein n=1 Tax=Echinostoma caproni TaxID=27848 RepID=A0A183B0F0_9TREM